jgi:hypothetical protein
MHENRCPGENYKLHVQEEPGNLEQWQQKRQKCPVTTKARELQVAKACMQQHSTPVPPLGSACKKQG